VRISSSVFRNLPTVAKQLVLFSHKHGERPCCCYLKPASRSVRNNRLPSHVPPKRNDKNEAKQAHLNAIAKAIDDRKQDLIKAAEWWRRSRGITDFVEESERRWKIPSGVLDPEQAAWLAWAKEIANSMSPFTAGYPDPPKHGAFDPSTIPFGGTYPTAQNLPPVS